MHSKQEKWVVWFVDYTGGEHFFIIYGDKDDGKRVATRLAIHKTEYGTVANWEVRRAEETSRERIEEMLAVLRSDK